MNETADKLSIAVSFRDFAAQSTVAAELSGSPWQRVVPELAVTMNQARSARHFFYVTVEAPGGTHAVKIDDELTFSELHSFANGRPLSIDNGGRGGGNIMLLSEWIDAGFTVHTVTGLLAGAMKSYDALVNAPNRRAAREWMESDEGVDGPPHRALVRRVRRYRAYTVSEIELIYGVSTSDARAILKASGFRFSPAEERSGWGGPDYWVRVG